VFVSIVLPCLNERATVAICVREALAGLYAAGFSGEVIVADNGSSDGSPEAAETAGAKVVRCARRGYGAALRAGFTAARGNVFVMADADGTYDLSHLPRFVVPLCQSGPGGAKDAAKNESLSAAQGPARRGGPTDFVIGNRYAGGIEARAMPCSHRYVGVPVLTWLLNRLFGTSFGDAHCGLRAFTREAYEQMDPQSTGMEFASELIVRAAQLGLWIEEVPTVLRRGPEGRVPHLRSLRDGWRHVRYLIAARVRDARPARSSFTTVGTSAGAPARGMQGEKRGLRRVSSR
jgi:glycosyltransferase involved in cell wall biosynthesis